MPSLERDPPSRLRMPVALLVAAGLALLACNKEAAPAKDEAAPTPAPAPAKAPAPEPKAAEPAAEPAKAADPAAQEPPVAAPAAAIPEADAKALLDLWLKAQNDGDFKAYEALFAQRFAGVRSSGGKSRTFDRKGWLADRQRMFKQKMLVEVKSPSFAVNTDNTFVSFQQKFTQGSFSDEGEKQLMLVREGGQTRIAREEMLKAKRVEAADTTVPPIERGLFLFAFESTETYVVLHDKPAPGWATGPGHVHLKGRPKRVDPVMVRKAAKMTAIPPDLAAWVGKEVKVYGASSEVCAGRVAELVVAARVYPHFGTRMTWEGTNPDEGEPPMTKAQIAKEAWDLAGPEGLVLAGRVEPTSGKCTGVAWARAADKPAPLVLAPAKAESALRSKVLQRFRQLPGYADEQKEFNEAQLDPAEPKPKWWDEYGKAKPAIKTWKDASGKALYVTVSSDAGGGCGDFQGQFWAIFAVAGEVGAETLVLASDGKAPGPFVRIEAAFDPDGDGAYEFLGSGWNGEDNVLIHRAGTVWRQTQMLDVPYRDCPC